ncbi:VOC family protein [Spartinivicinus poritis]|uniref:VOC family protein n=1 Tax=Spartinivicinus poritis TaxID=2994640 RepID=A0ABT5U682_9GAMM|nr:VOC family protein [Spartinivicinus sp. A2-2]MDE1461876.1 VOC family protein [Spartinivicinus sp. A2-2]
MTEKLTRLPSLTHIALHVQSLDECILFYQSYCNMQIIHQRHNDHSTVVWLAEAGRETEMIFVLMSGGPLRQQNDQGYGHLGFAVASRQSVDDIAAKATQDNCLIWPPKEDPFPVGYYCGVVDPNGNYVEFSYGQPLGPGAKPLPS